MLAMGFCPKKIQVPFAGSPIGPRLLEICCKASQELRHDNVATKVLGFLESTVLMLRHLRLLLFCVCSADSMAGHLAGGLGQSVAGTADGGCLSIKLGMTT